jgi:hypothetical protein
VTTKWKVVFQYQILDAQFAKTIKLAESRTSKGCTGKKIMKVKIKRLHGKITNVKKSCKQKKLALRAPFLDRKIGRDRLSLGPKKWPTGGLVRGSAAISSLGIVGLGTGFF